MGSTGAGSKEYRKVLDAIVRHEVRPLLTGLGFTADKRTFLRARGPLVDFVELVLRAFNTPDVLRFSLRVDLLVGDVASLGELKEGPVRSQTFPAWSHVFEPPYSVARGIEPVAVANRVVDDLTRVALPRLERFRSLDDVIAFLDDEDRRAGRADRAETAAMLLARAGRLVEAREHFLRATGDADVIRQAAAHFGITL
jgi:hypothetical protein